MNVKIKLDCAVRVSLESLAKFLGLAENVRIVSVFQDTTDHAEFSTSIVIVGDGVLRGAGGAVKYVPLDSIVQPERNP